MNYNRAPKSQLKQGLRQNWQQFSLLVLVNAFVGGMVGLERSIFPEFAEQEFSVQSTSAILSFITAFGFSKAFANYLTGRLINQWGRKRLLLAGWFIALPIPFLLIYAPSWNWVIFSNILLGLNQGLAWSATVIMKIDLVGQKDRGLAMGLNEFSGYFSVGLMAFLTGFIASEFGVTPYPFYLGIGLVLAGLLTTSIWVKDTNSFVEYEQQIDHSQSLGNIFIQTSFRHSTLSSVTQAGLINNLNDGMIWGLFPMLLLGLNYPMQIVGLLAAIYPSFWGFGQLFTGKMADHYSKKKMLFWGMFVQGLAILTMPLFTGIYELAVLAAVLGAGTALVYPTFLTTIASTTSPLERGESIGTFRLWRDLGYVFGAILSGALADIFGITVAILTVGALTIISSLIIQFRMPKE